MEFDSIRPYARWKGGKKAAARRKGKKGEKENSFHKVRHDCPCQHPIVVSPIDSHRSMHIHVECTAAYQGRSVFVRVKSDKVNSFGSSAFKLFPKALHGPVHSWYTERSREIERREGHVRDRGYRYGCEKGATSDRARDWALCVAVLSTSFAIAKKRRPCSWTRLSGNECSLRENHRWIAFTPVHFARMNFYGKQTRNGSISTLSKDRISRIIPKHWSRLK